MYIEYVPNRNSPPAVLLRESYRVDGKVKKRTLSNLSALPNAVIEGLKVLLRGGVALENPDAVLTIERSLPHGHVAAVLGAARGCGAATWFAGASDQLSAILMGLLVARVLEPSSKLATQRMLNEATAFNSLGRLLQLDAVKVDDLYRALDWLGEHQAPIEKTLAKQQLVDCTMVLYDLSSTWMTGNECPLATHGYSRDGKRHEPQIVFGLLCAPNGCPVAVEVFAGNTSDSKTVAAQIEKVKQRFGITRMAWVGDRGMITQTQIDTVLRPNGMDWISSLRAPQVAKLATEQGPFQPSLFDERWLLEVDSGAFPGERLIVCRNPLLAEERARKRETLLVATEAELEKISLATTRSRRRLQGKERIMARVFKVINRYKMAKHFELAVTETSFAYQRKTDPIKEEAALDGLYVIRTNLPKETVATEQVVCAYKNLAQVERAFRSMKTIDLHVRPIFHWNEQRVRAHVFLCLLAYYVEWHMRQKLKPMLFDDEYLDEVQAARVSPVTKALRSERAKAKDRSKLTEDGYPAHSFRTLLKDLATLAYNVVHTALNPHAQFVTTTRPTPVQQRAFDLLGLSPICTQ